jgi:indole-3-glycerol phosphate synthase
MTILDEIVAHKREQVRELGQRHPLALPAERPDPARDFSGALARPGLQVIAEIKRRSPSRGAIRPDIDPADLARRYESAGAAAISVLTDDKYFGGSLQQLQAVRAAVDLPVLRKDFIIDPYQVHESAAAGADAILLIADCLDETVLAELYELAGSVGLQVLVEGYSDHSLAAIRRLAPQVAGINSRDLATMQVNLAGMLERRSLLPEQAIGVAESGIVSADDLQAVASAGFDAALIGTTLLLTGDPGTNLQALLAGRPIPEKAA